MSKKKYKKSIKSFDKRIAEHREKQKITERPELIYYWEKEIQRFEREKKKKQKWL